MKKSIIISGPPNFEKLAKALEFVNDYSPENIELINGFDINSKYNFRNCEKHTEIIIIDNVNTFEELESLVYYCVNNEVEVCKQGKEHFFIEPQFIFITELEMMNRTLPLSFSKRVDIISYFKVIEPDVKKNIVWDDRELKAFETNEEHIEALKADKKLFWELFIEAKKILKRTENSCFKMHNEIMELKSKLLNTRNALTDIEKLYKGNYEMPASKALKKAQMIAFQSLHETL